MADDCIFCKIVNGEIPPGKGKVFEDKNFIGVLDINPLVKGHVVLFSKKHFANFLELPTSLGSEFLDAIKKTSLELIEKYGVESFNLHLNSGEVAGQIIPHFHFHILPRKKSDGFRPCA